MPAILRNLLLLPNVFSLTLLFSLKSLLFHFCLSIDEQGQALLSWKNSLNSSTDALSSWNPLDPIPCGWLGITCNSNGRVVQMSLKMVDLHGPLPVNFQPLESLNTIILSSANLTGKIPPEFGDYRELVVIEVSDNKITGKIPVEICRLQKLQTLSLHTNYLGGGIPMEIGNLSSLVYLTVYDNQITGEIPKSIGELTNLEVFRAGGNQNLKGELPREIGNCTNLVTLGLAETSISGSLPYSIGMLKRIQTIAIYTSLLLGPIPDEIGNCSELQNLYLHQNSISGSIPRRIEELKKLQNIGNCTNLYRFRVNNNRLGGTIPSEIGSLKSLNFLDMSNNRFTGAIPSSICGCWNLEFLDLHSNALMDSMPETLPKSLQFVDISGNHLTGALTPSIGLLNELTKLNLGKNRISGRIPAEILSCRKLQLLDLGSNNFTGEIPKELGQLPALEITLNLSCNRISGEIPAQFSGLIRLGVLDLSHNKLTGNLDILTELQNLVSLNVSFNDFSGDLPNTPFFRKLPLSNLEGNEALCISNTVNKIRHGVQSRSTMKLAMSILVSTSIVLILLAIYMLIRARINDTRLVENETWELTLYQKMEFSINEVVESLTPANVIGTGCSGIVYKITLPNGEALAVKKMRAEEETDAFSSEINSLGSIRHKNIVRLLGWGSNGSMKLLFYDYLPNGSLSSLLHGPGKGRAEWEARYDIVLGVAHALAYLHHDCAPSIIHGDVKAMNVLLGARCEPYLSDFGLARLIDNNSGSLNDCPYPNLSQRPVLAGSYGYMAPELASIQRVNHKSDVYSFGIVLLEVLTGRHPLDPTLPGGAHLVQWVRDHLHNKGDPGDILDAKLRGRADPQMHEILQTLAISFLCISIRADDRPTMRDVVAMIKEIHHIDSSRQEPDLTKGEAVESLPAVTPNRKVVCQGSSNCSFAFSDDSIC
ncbi:hypothetical protein Nepgr_026239 [Nepenthes gracilis]|uniref:Protein kinase domain-containing protein n=1 Tax=Nepenthes gracilis TaxID=150966 RepID=A0AAD3T9C8_NEPGR|nr:hypothetical protein Nepgr_026239 [Nepenthes gracilis]